MTSSADDFAVKIPSETSQGREVQERIMGLLETRSYPDRDLFGVRLALEEAIVNAIKHGNGMDPSKEVRIDCSFDDDRVTIVIEDEGPGFDVTSVPDPTSEENLDKPGGRGIMLMRSFMSRVEYNDSGNRLLLEKVRGTEDE
jgi:serine/threonine-protein kinase RsbW